LSKSAVKSPKGEDHDLFIISGSVIVGIVIRRWSCLLSTTHSTYTTCHSPVTIKFPDFSSECLRSIHPCNSSDTHSHTYSHNYDKYVLCAELYPI